MQVRTPAGGAASRGRARVGPWGGCWARLLQRLLALRTADLGPGEDLVDGLHGRLQITPGAQGRGQLEGEEDLYAARVGDGVIRAPGSLPEGAMVRRYRRPRGRGDRIYGRRLRTLSPRMGLKCLVLLVHKARLCSAAVAAPTASPPALMTSLIYGRF